MDLDAHDLRSAAQEICDGEVVDDLQQFWPRLDGASAGCHAALIVARALLGVLPTKTRNASKTAESTSPLLKLAWLRYKVLPKDAKEQAAAMASALPDSLRDIIESPEMRSGFWANAVLGAFFQPSSWIMDGRTHRLIEPVVLEPTEIGRSGLIQISAVEAKDLARAFRSGLLPRQDGQTKVLRFGNLPMFIRVLYTPGEEDGPGYSQLMEVQHQVAVPFVEQKKVVGTEPQSYRLIASVRLRDARDPGSRDAVRTYYRDGLPIRPSFSAADIHEDKVAYVQSGWALGEAGREYMLFYAKADVVAEQYAERYVPGPSQLMGEAIQAAAWKSFTRTRPAPRPPAQGEPPAQSEPPVQNDRPAQSNVSVASAGNLGRVRQNQPLQDQSSLFASQSRDNKQKGKKRRWADF